MPAPVRIASFRPVRTFSAPAIASAVLALAVVGLIFLLALRHGYLVSRAVWHESDEVLVLSTMGVLLLVAAVASAAPARRAARLDPTLALRSE